MAPNRTASTSAHCLPGGAMHAFVHLDVRSYFSVKDGAFSPEELAVRAAELGMPAVAVTDRDGLYGAARFVSACAQTGVGSILGATLTLRGAGCASGLPARCSDRFARLRTTGSSGDLVDARGGPLAASGDTSVVVLAADGAGYANLCRLITDSHMLGERGDPSLAVEQVLAHSQGLVCLLGPGSHLAALSSGDAVAELRRFRGAFGGRGVCRGER